MRKNVLKKSVLFSSISIFVLAFTIVVSTLPDGFEHYGDMGTSATGVAIARSYYNDLSTAFQDPPGYVYNGEYTVYGNWPPIGFILLANWLEFLGEDSIFNARLLPCLLYALSSSLFLLLLIRCRINREVAVISAILFSVLPFHLEFGKLIFSDMWLVPFWLLACHSFLSKKPYQWLIIPIGFIGAIGFMWFILFTVVAFLSMRIADKFKLSKKQTILFFLFGTIGIRLILWVLFNLFQEVYLLNSLSKWVGISVFQDHGKLFDMVKRVVTLLYEGFPVLLLSWILVRKEKTKNLFHLLKTNKEAFQLLKFTLITSIIFILILPNWVVTHAYGVSFFSIIIGLMVALLLQACNHVFTKHKTRIVMVSIIAGSLALFMLYPSITKGYQEAILFNLTNDVNWYHAFEFGIKEETESYIFSTDSRKNFVHLPSYFANGITQLKKNNFNDFDSTRVFFVTSRPDSIAVHVKDSLSVAGFHIYELSL